LLEAGTHGYCTGLDPGVKTFAPDTFQLDLTLSVEKGPDAGAADVKGHIGLKTDNALSLSSKIHMKKGCSRPERQQACQKDRYGFELCHNYEYM
jgi:hypothetical protein